MKKWKVLELFAGVGGLSFGFANNEHFEIIAANEIMPNAAKAYSLNHPTVKMYLDDIVNINSDQIMKDTGIDNNSIDIIIGGPPCQAYSTVGKRLIDDPRGKLFQEYYRILKEFRPKVFLYENVKGLLSMQGGELLETILALFESLGYHVQYKLLNAADFGAPQIRERVIIIGTLLNCDYIYPKPTHFDPSLPPSIFNSNLQPYLTIEDAISDLPIIKSGEEAAVYSCEPRNDFQKRMRLNSNILLDHNAAIHNNELIKLMDMLPDGGCASDLPENIRPKSGFKNTYCRLWWNRPSTTITRNLGTPSSSRCIHPKVARGLTTREGARLQCFPDNYRFYGSRSDMNLQIGNAVPTVLSEALAKSISELLLKAES